MTLTGYSPVPSKSHSAATIVPGARRHLDDGREPDLFAHRDLGARAAVGGDLDRRLDAPALRRGGGHEDLAVDHLVAVLAGGATPCSTQAATSRSACSSTPR